MEIRVAAETIKPVDGLVAKLVLEAGLKAVGTGEKLLDRIHKHLDGKKCSGALGQSFCLQKPRYTVNAKHIFLD